MEEVIVVLSLAASSPEVFQAGGWSNTLDLLIYMIASSLEGLWLGGSISSEVYRYIEKYLGQDV
ncbi:MAG: hypothetical protein DRG83_05265 [Deltaproteobacteria bacterium]|nr:MAG: hypothetical protein DRG83_05265 [Deltaproteobacteria bacterium]